MVHCSELPFGCDNARVPVSQSLYGLAIISFSGGAGAPLGQVLSIITYIENWACIFGSIYPRLIRSVYFMAPPRQSPSPACKAALNWIRTSLRPTPGKLPKPEVFAKYTADVGAYGVATLNASEFGKAFGELHPDVSTLREGHSLRLY